MIANDNNVLIPEDDIPLMPDGNLDLLYLFEVYGIDRARLFLQNYFKDANNFFAFTSLFHEMMPDAVPDIHRILISECMAGGSFAAALPRGAAKSTVVTVFWVAWLALTGQRHYILIVSDTHTQARAFVQTIKLEIENNKLLRLIFPNCVGDFWTQDQGIVIKSGSGHECKIEPIGSGMKVRGKNYRAHRPDQVVIDDLENSEGVYSAERRKKLKRWFDMDLGPAMDRYAKNIVYVGTILHYNALFKMVLDGKDKYRSWRRLVCKAIENGRSFWPARFSLSYLKAIRDDADHPDYVGSIVFAQEYQHDPQDDKDRIIQLDWIKEYSFKEICRRIEGRNDAEREDNFLGMLERVGALDPAISEKETADFSAIYALGHDPDTLKEYQLDLVRAKSSDPSEIARWCVAVIKRWRLTRFGVESVAFQAGMATLVRRELQRQKLYCKVVKLRTDKDKVRRARIHSVAFEGKFVQLRTDHSKHDIIKGEIEEFPLGEHDDCFDALMLARETLKKPTSRTFTHKPQGM